MKLILTSDIHLGNTFTLESPLVPPEPFDQKEHELFAAQIHAEKPDVLIVTGDCAESSMWDGHLKTFFEMYKNPHGDSICIPGNHDQWLSRPIRTTCEEKFQDFFVQATAHGWVGIKDEPWSKDGVYVAGGMGWYDYSSRNLESQQLTPEEFDEFCFFGRKWSDFGMMGMPSALAFNRLRMAEFESCMNKVPPLDQRNALIAISHFVGLSRLMVKVGAEDDFYAAFFGNFSLGKLVIEKDSDLYYCGHRHRRAEWTIGKTRCICNGSGYGRGSKRFDIVEI